MDGMFDVSTLFLPPPVPPPPPAYYLSAFPLSDPAVPRNRTVTQQPQNRNKEARLANFDLTRIPTLSSLIFNYGTVANPSASPKYLK